MKLDTYVDIRFFNSHGLSVANQISEMVAWIHAKGFPGRVAFAFPQQKTGNLPTPGNVLRVWSEGSSTLDELVQRLDASELSTSLHFKIAPHQSLASPWNGNWLEYRRFRIPSRRKKDMTPVRVEARSRKRALMIERSARLPFLNMRSFSNKQGFRLLFDPIQHAFNHSLAATPDSYGLSSEQNLTLVPDLD